MIGRNRGFVVVIDSTNVINNNTEILTQCTGNTVGDIPMLSMFNCVWCVKDICFTLVVVQMVLKLSSFLLEHLEKFKSLNC